MLNQPTMIITIELVRIQREKVAPVYGALFGGVIWVFQRAMLDSNQRPTA